MPIYDNLPEAELLSGTDKIAVSQDGVTRRTSVDGLIAQVEAGSIGFTPINKAGDTAVGPLSLASTLVVAGDASLVSVTISGVVITLNLPTSNSGLASGTWWNNGGFLCIA